MRKRSFLLMGPIAILLLASSALGQVLEPIVYTVRFPEPGKNEARVEAVVPTGQQPAVELMMPIWPPGYYRIEHHARRLTSFTARTPDGKMLKFEQHQKNRW